MDNISGTRGKRQKQNIPIIAKVGNNCKSPEELETPWPEHPYLYKGYVGLKSICDLSTVLGDLIIHLIAQHKMHWH